PAIRFLRNTPTCASFTMEPHPLAPLRLTAVGTATTGISNCRLTADLIVADQLLIRWGNIEARSIAGRRPTVIFDTERVGDAPPVVPRQGKPSAHLTKPRPYDFSVLKVIHLFQRISPTSSPPPPCVVL
ncbi:MAG: hypothetical protein ACLQBA_16720, partial [Candidatus Binataceae bacterium]